LPRAGTVFAKEMGVMRRASAGFTLAELLIVVAIIGIISAIAVPALMQAIDRAKQRRSMADMRSVAVAVSDYGVDFVHVPLVGSGVVEDLRPYLSPTYLKTMPNLDAWHNQIHYYGEGLDYTIWCYGADGIKQGSLISGPTTNFSDDIVVYNGVFTQWPEGMQVR
jgi:type II secretion system protein G